MSPHDARLLELQLVCLISCASAAASIGFLVLKTLQRIEEIITKCLVYFMLRPEVPAAVARSRADEARAKAEA